jgi:hypothetical protein
MSIIKIGLIKDKVSLVGITRNISGSLIEYTWVLGADTLTLHGDIVISKEG